tara:strand:+ start:321 stop:533 length:213 start_codon:yes stop_codon:yes gene_type:complete
VFEKIGCLELSPLSDARGEREEERTDDDEDNDDVGDDALRRRSTDDDDDETMWETKSEDLYKNDAGGDER